MRGVNSPTKPKSARSRAISLGRCYFLNDQSGVSIMAFSNDLFFAPAHQLAAMLRKRDVSSVEMVSAFVERIESVNHGLNAVVTLVEERAAREAEDSDKRLAGKGEIRP